MNAPLGEAPRAIVNVPVCVLWRPCLTKCPVIVSVVGSNLPCRTVLQGVRVALIFERPFCFPFSVHEVICPSCVETSVPVNVRPLLVRSTTSVIGDWPGPLADPVQ